MARPKRGRGRLTREQKFWLVDPLDQHFKPRPFPDDVDVNAVRERHRDDLLAFWREEYGSGTPPGMGA